MLRVGRPKNSRFQLITLAAVAFLATTAFLATPGQRTLADANETATNNPNASIQASIASGTLHTCALLTTGAVKCWGYNLNGQVGDGTTTDRLTPTDVTGLGSGVIAITAGGEHSCALLSTGGVKCWGYNLHGQLGDGTTTRRTTPVDVTGLTSGVSAITAGQYHTCALLSTGAMKCWGNNNYGQIGDGTVTVSTMSPTDVTGLSIGVTAISAYGYQTCALLSTGAMKCWGNNNNGQLGDGTTTNRNTPTDVSGLSSGVTAITIGSGHSCALLSTGAMKCWGNNNNGQLGDGTTTNRSTPTDVSGLSSGVSAITASALHTCALLSTGAVKCWGLNSSGQVGDNTTTNRSTPVDVTGLSSAVSAITAGQYHICAVTSSSGVKCWGNNWNGGLGDGTTTQRPTPTDVIGLTLGVGITTTTTATTTTTTTTVPSSSTTVAIASASSSTTSTSTSTTVAATTTSAPAFALVSAQNVKSPEIPTTGSNSAPLVLLAALSVFVGFVLVNRRRII